MEPPIGLRVSGRFRVCRRSGSLRDVIDLGGSQAATSPGRVVRVVRLHLQNGVLVPRSFGTVASQVRSARLVGLLLIRADHRVVKGGLSARACLQSRSEPRYAVDS